MRAFPVTFVTGRYVPGSAVAPAASLVSLSPVAGFAAFHIANAKNQPVKF